MVEENGIFENSEHISKKLIIAIVLLGLVVAFIPIGLTVSFIHTYNELVDLEEDVELSKANVQEKMQRRLELLTDLMETVEASTDYKERSYEYIADAQAALVESLKSGDTQEIGEANAKLTIAINDLIKAIDKNYPELISGEEYTRLMDDIEGSINRISIARDTYNAYVSEYNRKIRKFPGAWVAKFFGFKEIEPFEADEAAKSVNIIEFN